MAKNIKQGIDNDSLQKLVKKANQRIVRIEQRYGKNRWAVKSLKANLNNDLLNAWTKKGRIRIPKTASEDDIEKIRLITEKFIKSPTSTLRGIEKQKGNVMQTIYEKGLSHGIELDDDQVYQIYEMLNDDNVNWLMDEMRLGSDVWMVVSDAFQKRESKNSFVERLSNYINSTNDEDAKEKLEEIYNKYIG